MRSLRRRAPSGWCRSPHPAVRRSRDWCAPACAISPATRRVRRPAAIDPRPAPESGSPAHSRHDQPRGDVRPRFQAHPAPSSGAARQRQYRPMQARRGRNRWWDDRSCGQRRPSGELAAQQNLRFGKRLDGEIYVASEASATPLRSYAPQSNFSALQRVSLPWTPGTEMLSSPGFPIAACAEAIPHPANHHQAAHFRRNFIMTRDHSGMANAIRGLAMDAVEKAKSGHPGLPMGAADIATVLFTQFLKFDAADPRWPDRDRFVLSAGHGSMLLYALLYLTGNKDMTLDQIKHFRQLGSLTPGHPENFYTKGIETTTGPLGQGIATAVGMALAEKMLAAEFGKKVVSHHTYVLASDGDLMEGVSQEAIALAGHWKLNKLIVLYDYNGISIDGPTSLSDSVDQVKRFKSAGWAAELIDGQDQKAIAAAITRAQKSNKPTLIACKTTIGYGAPTRAGTAKAHGEALGAEELKGAKEKLGISLEPFSVPDDVLTAWRAAGSRGAAVRQEWEGIFGELGNRKRAEFERRLRHERPASLAKALRAHKKGLLEKPENIATR